MAYSSVGRPVFYIDNYLYHKTIGTSIENNIPEDIFTLSPAIPSIYEYSNSIHLPVSTDNYDFNGNMKYYFAFLNHVFSFSDIVSEIAITPNTNSPMTITEVLNVNAGDSDIGNTISPLKGSTIFTTTTSGVSFITLVNNFTIGAISTGIQYTMPHSPDLKLSMEIEMDGIKTTNTSGGGTISNVKYTGNPLWVNGNNRTNCFDVYEDTLDVTQTGARRNGRKSWNLKFSYMSEADLFSSNPKGGNYTEHPADSTYNNGDLSSGAQHSENTLAFNIETDDSFYAQVWNKTLGGALPFIFQPNSNDNDDFYICRFDQNSLRVSQSAYKVYDISVKIVETW